MISFVYFDVGGVTVDDISGTGKWIKMKRDIGIKPKDDEEFDRFYDEYEKEVCLGKDIDTIIPLIKERFHINFPTGYSMFFDFISRFKQNKYIWPVIDKIKQDCQVGLLTNMYPKMLPTMIEKELMPPVIWDVIIDSSIVYCWKPDLAIFKLAEQKANAKKKNILFIDNKIANINAAKNFGWQTFLYNPSDHDKSCVELLDYYNRIK